MKNEELEDFGSVRLEALVKKTRNITHPYRFVR